MPYGNKLKIGVVSAAALIFAGLLVKEYSSAKAAAVLISEGDGGTGPEFDEGFKPVEAGRRYVGSLNDNEKQPGRVLQMRMAITALNAPQVTVQTEIPSGTDDWTGTYDPATRRLVLKSEPANFMDLQYSNGGHWEGVERLVRGRLPNGERDYASFPIHLAAKLGQPPLAANASAVTSQPTNLQNWPHKRLITIDHSKVSGDSDLKNFPMLFSLTDADFKSTRNGGGVSKSDGADILFTAQDGNPLNHEIESYNEDTGELVAWVQIPSLSPNTDTNLYVYYGNPTPSNQQNRTAVWDSNFVAVIHFPSSSTLSGSDSTAVGNNLTNSDASAGPGYIGGAGRTAANSSFLFCSNPVNFPSGTSPRTLETWFKKTSGNEGEEIVAIGDNFSDGGRFAAFFGKDNLGVETRNDFKWFPWSNDGNWHHIALVLPPGESGTAAVLVYFDGTLQSATGGNLALSTSATDFTVGTIAGARGKSGFTGLVDEVRVSNSARSADWIATEYQNQSAPAQFVALAPR